MVSAELSDPLLDSLLETVNQDVRDSLVKLIDPYLQIRVALNLEDIDDLLNLFDLLGQDLLVKLTCLELL